ncbi:MAG: hypothetical protein DA408_17365 [Bacteroidetes bacterium]|nr:MAG: hypothetical protein C7N36_20515 [Bacteroidota bacterium]PTM09877.1 MAG: hypothetical protein DA408_17365 [Bacteroidota bacterium]
MSASTILDYWEPSEDPTLVLRYFYLDAEAQLAALQLRQAGIPSFITSSNIQTMLPLGQGWIGLHIRKRDFTSAVVALKAADMWEEPDTTGGAAVSTKWVLVALAVMLAVYLVLVLV